MRQLQLLRRLCASLVALTLPHPLRIGIDGIDNAGKTTFADATVPLFAGYGRPVIRASMDSFHRARSLRYARGRFSPEGYYYDSFDYEAVVDCLLAPLGPNGSRGYRTAAFDLQADLPVLAPSGQATPDTILVFDGVFLFRPELSDSWDVKIFLDISFEEAIARAVRRDLHVFGSEATVRKHYDQRYVPGQRLYLQACRPKEQAHIVIDNSDPAAPRLLHSTFAGILES